jgi:hypothetical protein
LIPGERTDEGCCSKNSSDFPTWWSKVASVISSFFVREKSSSPPRFHGFRMRCARWRVFSRVKCRFLDGHQLLPVRSKTHRGEDEDRSPASWPHFAKCDPLVMRTILRICVGKDAFLYPGGRGPVDSLATGLMSAAARRIRAFSRPGGRRLRRSSRLLSSKKNPRARRVSTVSG